MKRTNNIVDPNGALTKIPPYQSSLADTKTQTKPHKVLIIEKYPEKLQPAYETFTSGASINYDYQVRLPDHYHQFLQELFMPVANEVLAEAGNNLIDYNERQVVLDTVKSFVSRIGNLTGGTFIGIVHGSYATGNQKRRTSSGKGSDIDVVFSCDNKTYDRFKNVLLHTITYFIENLHALVGAETDDEIPGSTKHLIPASCMMEAAQAAVFYPNGSDQYPIIDPLSCFLIEADKTCAKGDDERQRFSKEFLSSQYLLHRLIFNILTSPHKIYSNQPEEVSRLKSVAALSLQLLSRNLQNLGGQPGSSGVEHLFSDNHENGNNHGEMFLGYKRNRNGMTEHLKNLLMQTV